MWTDTHCHLDEDRYRGEGGKDLGEQLVFLRMHAPPKSHASSLSDATPNLRGQPLPARVNLMMSGPASDCTPMKQFMVLTQLLTLFHRRVLSLSAKQDSTITTSIPHATNKRLPLLRRFNWRINFSYHSSSILAMHGMTRSTFCEPKELQSTQSFIALLAGQTRPVDV